VQRTRALLYVVDASGFSGRDPIEDLMTVRGELEKSCPELLARRALLAATKRDAVAAQDPLEPLRAAAARLGLETVPLSAVSGAGLTELKRLLLGLAGQGEPALLPESA
jgi:GTP-binding protein